MGPVRRHAADQHRRYALMHQLLPYIEQENLFTKRWDDTNFSANRLDGNGVQWAGVVLLQATGEDPDLPVATQRRHPEPHTGPNGRYFLTSYYGSAGTRG